MTVLHCEQSKLNQAYSNYRSLYYYYWTAFNFYSLVIAYCYIAIPLYHYCWIISADIIITRHFVSWAHLIQFFTIHFEVIKTSNFLILSLINTSNLIFLHFAYHFTHSFWLLGFTIYKIRWICHFYITSSDLAFSSEIFSDLSFFDSLVSVWPWNYSLKSWSYATK